MTDLKSLAQGLPSTAYLTETDYYAAWNAHALGTYDPLTMALRGGLLTGNRFAWIFCAGYQAAMRHTFSECEFGPWGALAVSEDRSDVDPRPGVTGSIQGEHIRLEGFKTWVAASELVEDLIISARVDSATRYIKVNRNLPGLSITTKPKGRVLPDLSQGIAHFDSALVANDAVLDKPRVKYFGPAEVLYIYAAFLASTWRHLPARQQTIEGMIPLLQRCSNTKELTREGEMHELDALVQSLLQTLREQEFSDDEKWRREYKLIAMYSKQ